MTTHEPLPCPFCNGTDITVSLGNNAPDLWRYYVYCHTCNARGGPFELDAAGQVQGETVKAWTWWNTRPIENALRTEIERLKKANLSLREMVGREIWLAETMETKANLEKTQAEVRRLTTRLAERDRLILAAFEAGHNLTIEWDEQAEDLDPDQYSQRLAQEAAAWLTMQHEPEARP